jgi:branched-chain amino acid transport system permease protein
VADEGMREFGDWRDMGLGLIMALFVIFLPRGLIGLTDRLRTQVKDKPLAQPTVPERRA